MRTQLMPALATCLLVGTPHASAQENAPDAFVAATAKAYGETGRRAAEFLMANAPDADKTTLSAEFLTDNLALAMEARERFPWARTMPETLF